MPLTTPAECLDIADAVQDPSDIEGVIKDRGEKTVTAVEPAFGGDEELA